MTEKRFMVETVEIIGDCNEDNKRIVKAITDKNELYTYSDIYEICELLNEQDKTIKKQAKKIMVLDSLIPNELIEE